MLQPPILLAARRPRQQGLPEGRPHREEAALPEVGHHADPGPALRRAVGEGALSPVQGGPHLPVVLSGQVPEGQGSASGVLLQHPQHAAPGLPVAGHGARQRAADDHGGRAHAGAEHQDVPVLVGAAGGHALPLP